MMVFISNKTTCLDLSSGRRQVLTKFIATRIIYNVHKPRIDVEISPSTCILS